MFSFHAWHLVISLALLFLTNDLKIFHPLQMNLRQSEFYFSWIRLQGFMVNFMMLFLFLKWESVSIPENVWLNRIRHFPIYLYVAVVLLLTFLMFWYTQTKKSFVWYQITVTDSYPFHITVHSPLLHHSGHLHLNNNTKTFLTWKLIVACFYGKVYPSFITAFLDGSQELEDSQN